MFKIGLIGFGRIGRSLFRQISQRDDLQVVAINEIIEDLAALQYSLKFDSEYGMFPDPIDLKEDCLHINNKKTQFFHCENILAVPWKNLGVDLIVDASGVEKNSYLARQLVDKIVPQVILTNAFVEADKMIVIGTNEDELDLKRHQLISGSICDVVGTSVLLKIVEMEWGIEAGHIMTLHPWLNYQNLLDAPLPSKSFPGRTFNDFALGRGSVGNLIPKQSSLVKAMVHLPEIKKKLNCHSVRVPTAVVASAHITLNLKRKTSREELFATFAKYEKILNRHYPVFKINADPLVSSDFKNDKHFCVLDQRWTQVDEQGKFVSLQTWYDNESGYASHTLSLIDLIKRIRE